MPHWGIGMAHKMRNKMVDMYMMRPNTTVTRQTRVARMMKALAMWVQRATTRITETTNEKAQSYLRPLLDQSVGW